MLVDNCAPCDVCNGAYRSNTLLISIDKFGLRRSFIKQQHKNDRQVQRFDAEMSLLMDYSATFFDQLNCQLPS